MDEDGKNEWQVVVDGKPTQVLALDQGRHSYTVQLPRIAGRIGRPVIQTIEFVRRTEPFVGTTHFCGVALDGGTTEPRLPARRHIEVVGDSITCGYGNEGANQNEHFKPSTENAYMSYASIAARLVHADVSIIAWSGRKMWPDNTTPSIYDLVLPAKGSPAYDFRGPKPEAVVINLATNDFGPSNPDEQQWTAAYEAFIHRIWSHYPKALVYCATGSMMSDSYPPGRKALSTVNGYLQRMINRMHDPRLHFIEFAQQRMEDGLGSDWHPSVKTDGIMGAKLADALKRDLGWQ